MDRALLSEPADLFTSRERRRNAGYRYLTSLDAVGTYCVKELGPGQLSQAVAIEAGDNRYDGRDIRSLCTQPNFRREAVPAP